MYCRWQFSYIKVIEIVPVLLSRLQQVVNVQLFMAADPSVISCCRHQKQTLLGGRATSLEKRQVRETWMQFKDAPYLTFKPPLSFLPLSPTLSQTVTQNWGKIKWGVQSFSCDAFLLLAWQSICGGTRPEHCTLAVSHPANIYGKHVKHTADSQSIVCFLCVYVSVSIFVLMTNIRLDRGLRCVILTQRASGLHSISTTHTINSIRTEKRSEGDDPVVHLQILEFIFFCYPPLESLSFILLQLSHPCVNSSCL